MKMNIIEGNLLLAEEKFLCHQCNTVSNKAAGLAKDIFDTFPYANIYKTRTKPHSPGNIIVCGDGIEKRLIVNMLAQLYPGPPNKGDTAQIREHYFQICLDQLAAIPELESVAMPVGMGCGLAKGNWDNYLAMIERFAEKIHQQQGAKVVLYKRNQ